VDPAAAGPQFGAVLGAAAAALAAPSVIPPPLPAGIDSVSVAAANHITVNAGHLSAQFAAGAGCLAEGAQTVTAVLGRYLASDAHGAALVGGSGAPSAGGAVAGIDIPVPPAVDIPDLSVDIAAALAAVAPEPDVVDAALRGGAGEAGLEEHAAAWASAAAQLGESGQSVVQLAAGLPASWSGPAAEALSGRLHEFGRWMEHSSMAASGHAAAVRQCGAHWSAAVNDHPRGEDYRATQQVMLAAVKRAAAGDPRGAAEASRAEAELMRMKEQSLQAMNSYGQGAGGTNSAVERPGDSPKISGDGDPRIPDKPAKEYGKVAPGEDLEGSVAGDAGDAAGQSLHGAMESLMQLPSPLAGSVGQSLSKAGQSLGQAGQQPAQAVSQLGNMLGGGSPAGGMPSGSPMGGMPRNPSGKLGDGGGLGGGAGGGGRTMPASLPEQSPPRAVEPPPSATAAIPTGGLPKTPVGAGGMGGMMPMGMMPHGGKGSGGKELDRNPEWSPDEPLVKDAPEVTEPIAGQRKRVRPTET
jgi:hypothetical protein